MVTWPQLIAAYMPAAVIMVTILLGIMSNNRAIDGVHCRIDGTNHRFDDLRNDLGERFDDFRNEFRERFDRIEQRLTRLGERIEHPVVKGT
jgi:hypothetical protein